MLHQTRRPPSSRVQAGRFAASSAMRSAFRASSACANSLVSSASFRRSPETSRIRTTALPETGPPAISRWAPRRSQDTMICGSPLNIASARSRLAAFRPIPCSSSRIRPLHLRLKTTCATIVAARSASAKAASASPPARPPSASGGFSATACPPDALPAAATRASAAVARQARFRPKTLANPPALKPRNGISLLESPAARASDARRQPIGRLRSQKARISLSQAYEKLGRKSLTLMFQNETAAGWARFSAISCALPLMNQPQPGGPTLRLPHQTHNVLDRVHVRPRDRARLLGARGQDRIHVRGIGAQPQDFGADRRELLNRECGQRMLEGRERTAAKALEDVGLGAVGERGVDADEIVRLGPAGKALRLARQRLRVGLGLADLLRDQILLIRQRDMRVFRRVGLRHFFRAVAQAHHAGRRTLDERLGQREERLAMAVGSDRL